MARSSSRTLVIVALLILAALAIRWSAGDWVMARLTSLHGPVGH